jgi:hypothetical protein
LIVSPKHNALLKDSVSYMENEERCSGYNERERELQKKLLYTAFWLSFFLAIGVPDFAKKFLFCTSYRKREHRFCYVTEHRTSFKSAGEYVKVTRKLFTYC